ncbi:MAG TPA: hypothetical protein DCS24_04375 [Erythrobacter sp.]|nr:hypothetical protein [Erythrobacter sp.]
MLIAILFILGIGNFAMHKAVLESGHPLLDSSPWFLHLLGGRVSLFAEFLILLAAMLLALGGWAAPVWFYAGYSLLNALAAWLILTGKV